MEKATNRPDEQYPSLRESRLMPEGNEPPPLWVWLTVACVLVFSVIYLGRNMGDFSTRGWFHPKTDTVAVASAAVDGATIFTARCVACHQANGQGMPGTFPPLADAEWVTGEKAPLIQIVLHGLGGPVNVKNISYNGAMPAWGNILSDEEVAALLTYIRSNFGNTASEVTPEEVAAVRKATSDKSTPWTADELRKPINVSLTP